MVGSLLIHAVPFWARRNFDKKIQYPSGLFETLIIRFWRCLGKDAFPELRNILCGGVTRRHSDDVVSVTTVISMCMQYSQDSLLQTENDGDCFPDLSQVPGFAMLSTKFQLLCLNPLNL